MIAMARLKQGEGCVLTEVTILLDDAALALYGKIAERFGLPLERVLADALFKLAGELSLEAIHGTKRP